MFFFKIAYSCAFRLPRPTLLLQKVFGGPLSIFTKKTLKTKLTSPKFVQKGYLSYLIYRQLVKSQPFL